MAQPVRDYNRVYQKVHQGQIRERQHAYYETHKEQAKENARKWVERNPDRAKIAKIKNNYGVTTEEAECLLAAKKAGICAICGENRQPTKTLHIDHDHVTGKVCGVICGECNLGLGRFQDNSDLLRKALDYNDRVRGGNKC
jgi:hypothetical protein